MDEKDLLKFNVLMKALEDKNNYWQTKVDEYELKLLIRLTELPNDRVFAALDLYRMFLTHPAMAHHFKKFEDGAARILRMVGLLENK